MSKAAEYLLELEKNDFRLLTAVEVGMRTAEYVSVDSMVEFSKLTPDQVIKRLDNLHYKDLLFRWKGQFTGYQLTHHGYDVLAFRALSERDTIIAIGRELGKGKESDVFLAYDEEQTTLVAKIHRVGRPSFQRSKKLRGYLGSKGHINWLYKSRLSAEREILGIKIANKIKLKAPKAIDGNRHIVIMEFFEGTELVNIGLKNPLKIFNGIISEIRKLFVKGKIVHGDLSEYNVIITPKEDFLIIDFPQYESAEHVNAGELLYRDINNICKYFKRKFKVESDPQTILEVIVEEYEKQKL
ncbi:MAG: serine/threonine protein phosphatase [Candidatus Heimdallarchaeota archaeon]|nr:serine/threonine protein phosphatase [Candidatus Heimdallarchaeota archaeon]MCK5297700.1 serine/threonine protein phosphatase [Candidatus Heimdallarchaeota archaeon]